MNCQTISQDRFEEKGVNFFSGVSCGNEKALNSVFRWKTQQDEFIPVTEMKTAHLYHTLRMIWNNSCPAPLRVGEVRMYKFGPFYTTQYITSAIRAIIKELYNRTDIPKKYFNELSQIYDNWAYYMANRIGE